MARQAAKAKAAEALDELKKKTAGKAKAGGQPHSLAKKQKQHVFGGYNWKRDTVPLPDLYFQPNAPFRRRRSLTMLIHEAERAVKTEDAERWLQDMEK